MPRPIVWFEAVGQHGDNLKSFYGEVLGWRFDAETAARPAPPHPLRAALPFLRRPAAPAPWWVTFYTRVPDLDAAIAKARSLGSRVLVPPTRHGDSVIAVVSDPEGHPLGLCT
jgi:predicted enzyme related to lactoylglutathione lyase